MIYAIRNNEELKGVYSREEFKEQWSTIEGLSVRRFKDKDRKLAEQWLENKRAVNGRIKAYKKKKNPKQNATSKKVIPIGVKPIKAIKKVKELLEDKNIVTGYGSECKHQEFDLNVTCFLCPWDKRVLEGYDGSVNLGCYYKCEKQDNKILENKYVYLKAIDRLIVALEKNPNIHKDFKVENRILTMEEEKILTKWDKSRKKNKNYFIKKTKI